MARTCLFREELVLPDRKKINRNLGGNDWSRPRFNSSRIHIRYWIRSPLSNSNPAQSVSLGIGKR